MSSVSQRREETLKDLAMSHFTNCMRGRSTPPDRETAIMAHLDLEETRAESQKSILSLECGWLLRQHHEALAARGLAQPLVKADEMTTCGISMCPKQCCGQLKRIRSPKGMEKQRPRGAISDSLSGLYFCPRRREDRQEFTSATFLSRCQKLFAPEAREG